MRKILGVFTLVFFLALAPLASAHHQAVLGISTETSSFSIPPTVEGPGLILPDSPLFFIDQLKQGVRLLLTFSPEQKAKVYEDIAGERMAELRIMLARNNKSGIQTGLQGVAENLSQAASSLSEAQLTGREVWELAKEINNTIKEKQQILDVLESQAGEETKAQVKSALASLLQAKVKTEDALPSELLENEIRDDLQRLVKKRTTEASESAQELKNEIDALQAQAIDSMQKSLKRREEALQKAISEKNDTLKKVAETQLVLEKNKQQELLKVQTRAVEEARKAVEAAQKAAAEFDKANHIRSQSVSGVSTAASYLQ